MVPVLARAAGCIEWIETPPRTMLAPGEGGGVMIQSAATFGLPPLWLVVGMEAVLTEKEPATHVRTRARRGNVPSRLYTDNGCCTCVCENGERRY